MKIKYQVEKIQSIIVKFIDNKIKKYEKYKINLNFFIPIFSNYLKNFFKNFKFVLISDSKEDKYDNFKLHINVPYMFFLQKISIDDITTISIIEDIYYFLAQDQINTVIFLLSFLLSKRKITDKKQIKSLINIFLILFKTYLFLDKDKMLKFKKIFNFFFLFYNINIINNNFFFIDYINLLKTNYFNIEK